MNKQKEIQVLNKHCCQKHMAVEMKPRASKFHGDLIQVFQILKDRKIKELWYFISLSNPVLDFSKIQVKL